ncbi:DEAD/DEAH box helicase family protein [Lacinutrix salivirga]
MKLPNIHFQDFPVDFKKIESSDFSTYLTSKKILIKPNDKGYINESLQDSTDINEKNTVVINAAVGQGKTTSIIKIVKRFYEAKDEDYLIFVASPFVSLVEQYYNKIIAEGVPESQVYRYEFIGERNNVSYLNKKVQIITVNGLLGNPGEDAFVNSQAKRDYLNNLVENCKLKKRKVVIIYDEIHDAVHNFKQEYIFNLWKWKDVIHKNFVLSATYSEASKIVIEYLAELTNKSIKIIESERVRIPRNQSALYLHYNPSLYYKSDNEGLVRVVKDIVSRGKEIDVLCYSKNLADAIISKKNTGVGKVLYDKYEILNNCTSDLRINQRLGRLEVKNRFDNSKCNIGTNFKTGVSIEKKNHAFLIILPPKGSMLPFKNLQGIFTGGVNSIIQALARQRKRGGEIHVILPPPDEFDYATLPFKKNRVQYNNFVEFYDLVKSKSKTKDKVLHIPTGLQNMLIYDFYENKLKKNIESEIKAVKEANRVDKLSLKFPDFKSYVLNHGEEYLAQSFKFSGGDLSAFITYSAITNQFVNCNFSGFTSNSTFTFEENKIQMLLGLYFENYVSEDMYETYRSLNDFNFYLDFKNDFFEYNVRFIKNAKSIPIKVNNNPEIEAHIIGFVQRFLYPNSKFTKSIFYLNGDLFDYTYQRKDYFLSCLSHVSEVDLSIENIIRVNSFKTLAYFRNKLITNIKIGSTVRKGEFEYLPKSPFAEFVLDSEVQIFEDMIDYFINEDYFIKNNVFKFNQTRFKSTYTTKQKIKSFYSKILLVDFFETSDYKLTIGTRSHVKIINAIYEIPKSCEVLELISLPRSIHSEEFYKNNTYKVVEGVLVKE